MAGKNLKQIKVIFYPGLYLETGMNIHKADCATVQHYDYSCRRERDYRGEPTGATISTCYNLTIRNFSVEIEKFLLANMQSLHPENFTILINATFDKENRLQNAEDKITLRGYVVDLKEKFESYGSLGDEDAQRQMQFTILLCSMTYSAQQKDIKLEISND